MSLIVPGHFTPPPNRRPPAYWASASLALNQQSSLARGLIGWWPINPADGNLFGATGAVRPVVMSPVRVTGVATGTLSGQGVTGFTTPVLGPNVVFNSNLDNVAFGDLAVFGGLTRLTVACRFIWNGSSPTGTQGRRIISKWGNTFAVNTEFVCAQSLADESVLEFAYLQNSTNYGYFQTSAGSITAGTPYNLVFRWNGGTAGTIWINGVMSSGANIGVGSPTALLAGTGSFNFGADTNANASSIMQLADVVVSSRGWTDAEIFAWSVTDPWQMYAPEHRRIFKASAAPGGATWPGYISPFGWR